MYRGGGFRGHVDGEFVSSVSCAWMRYACDGLVDWLLGGLVDGR